MNEWVQVRVNGKIVSYPQIGEEISIVDLAYAVRVECICSKGPY